MTLISFERSAVLRSDLSLKAIARNQPQTELAFDGIDDALFDCHPNEFCLRQVSSLTPRLRITLIAWHCFLNITLHHTLNLIEKRKKLIRMAK